MKTIFIVLTYGRDGQHTLSVRESFANAMSIAVTHAVAYGYTLRREYKTDTKFWRVEYESKNKVLMLSIEEHEIKP